MDNKQCEEILIYMDDILDGQADASVQSVFKKHIEQCEKCRTKYEIYCKIKTLLRSSLPEPAETLKSEIDRQIGTLTSVVIQPMPKKKSALHYTVIVFAILAVLAAIFLVLFAIIGRTAQEEEPIHIHLNEQGEVQKMTLSSEAGTELINNEFFPLLRVTDDYYKADPYLYNELIYAFESVDKSFNRSYAGVLFVMAPSFDDVNKADEISYYEGTGNGSVAFFSCKMSYLEFSTTFTSLYEEFYVPSGIQSDTILLVVCLT